MKTFKDYENLIKDIVSKESDRDSNWDWDIKSLDDNVVEIRWGYLVYLGEKNDSFLLKLSKDTDDEDCFISGRTPYDQMIDGHIVAEHILHGWQESYENAIKYSLEEIFEYAHSRY